MKTPVPALVENWFDLRTVLAENGFGFRLWSDMGTGLAREIVWLSLIRHEPWFGLKTGLTLGLVLLEKWFDLKTDLARDLI